MLVILVQLSFSSTIALERYIFLYLVPIHLLIVCMNCNVSSSVSLSMISSSVSLGIYAPSSLSLSFCNSSSLSAGIGNSVTLLFLL